MAIDESTRVDDVRWGKVGAYTWQRTYRLGKCYSYLDNRDVMQYAFGQVWPMFSFLIVKEEWFALSAADKDAWKTKAGRTGPWGQNLFVKKYWADNKEEVEDAGKALALLPGAMSQGKARRRRCKTILSRTS